MSISSASSIVEANVAASPRGGGKRHRPAASGRQLPFLPQLVQEEVGPRVAKEDRLLLLLVREEELDRRARAVSRAPQAAGAWSVRLLGKPTKRRAQIRELLDVMVEFAFGHGAPGFTPGRDSLVVQRDAVGPERLERRLFHPAEIVVGLKEFDGCSLRNLSQNLEELQLVEEVGLEPEGDTLRPLEQLVSTRKLGLDRGRFTPALVGEEL